MTNQTMSSPTISNEDLEKISLKCFLDIFPFTNLYVFENQFTKEQIEKYVHLIESQKVFELGSVHKLNRRGQVYKIYHEQGEDYAILFLISQKNVSYKDINVMLNNMYPLPEITNDNFRDLKPTITHTEIITCLDKFSTRGWIIKENEEYKITKAGKWIVDNGRSMY